MSQRLAIPMLDVSLRRTVPWVLLMAALLLLFRDTAVAMVEIWIRSDTFAHAFLVPPIVLWLVWRRRASLATIPIKPRAWLLVPMALACLLWLIGELAASNAVTQFALVLLIVLSVPVVFGIAVARELTFPLLFLFFAVPVGEFMVPKMMEWTADFTVAALQFTQVPVYREGLQFVIPTGSWSVVQACSGVRYLIASFMVGTLFAYLNFIKPYKRAIFIALSLLVPIVANWLRAYLIVMLGHLSGNKLAAGVDHLVYGWLFFGIVIGVLFMLGARYADPPLATPAVSSDRPASSGKEIGRSWGLGVLVLALLLGTHAWGSRLLRESSGVTPAMALPAAPGWAQIGTPESDWSPNFANASLSLAQQYTQDARRVAVHLVYYLDQSYERKLVSSTNTLVQVTDSAKWAQVDGGTAALQMPGKALAWRTAVLRGASLHESHSAQRLRVWQVYWIGGRPTISDTEAKLVLAINKLLGRRDDGAAVFLSTPLGTSVDEADALLQRFAADFMPVLFRQLESAPAAP